jgi:hypothetical protein
MNGSFFERQVYYKSDFGISDYMAQESGQKWVIAEGATAARKYHLRQTSVKEGGEMRVESEGTMDLRERLEKAPEQGEAMIVSLPRFNNHREHRGHREKLHSNSFFQNNYKNNKPQINADERRFVIQHCIS